MDCVVPGLEEEFSREYHEIFERPDSVLAQPGRLKYEGIFGSGYFRTMKSYYLEKLTEEEKDVCRMKGVAHAVQRKMKPAQFGQSEREIDFFAAYSLRPTLAGEMTIVRTVRKNNCSINFKRHTLAGSSGGGERRLVGLLSFLKPSTLFTLQGLVHTVPLD